MTGSRIAHGGRIDRTRPLPFRFDGRSFTGFEGDTLTSALMAAGVRIMGRSFKYHRPRGPWAAWTEDPNAIFDVTLNGVTMPNVPGAATPLEAGMELRAVNAWPSAARDVKGVLDLAHRWLPAGFYYKTFMRPDWHLFEPLIRRAAGLGRVTPDLTEEIVADQRHASCDLLVIGGGAAGLVAAEAAAQAGRHVWLVEDHPEPGGALWRLNRSIGGLSAAEWVAERRAAIEAAGGRVLCSTTAFGAYDHGLYALITRRGLMGAPVLTRLRATRVVLATGAIDRPVTFANNDLPGILSLEAGMDYLGRYGVLAGRRIVLAANHLGTELARSRLEGAGAEVAVMNPAVAPMMAHGKRGVTAMEQAGRHVMADAVLASAGANPLLHLWRQAGGKLDWNADLAAFLPGRPPDGMVATGAAAGLFDMQHALEHARALALGDTPPAAPERLWTVQSLPALPDPKAPGRQWIDFQHDVTLKDVALAARENFVSVEHLKRYTTLGMAQDQGKTSNVPGLLAMAALQNRPVPQVGTTTFRPPYTPVPLETYRGAHRGQLFAPLRRLAIEDHHRAAGAAMVESGGSLRPGWYGPEAGPEAAQAEALRVRQSGGLFDGSPLGKIEVMGPDAESFVNFVYYNTMRTLKPGRIRYGFMLTERGVVYDDGVVMRMGQDRFVISCSSSHVDGVNALLETWRQDGNDPDRIFVHDTTDHWSTVSVTGPQARAVLTALALDADLTPGALPHMAFTETHWQGTPLRIARVSFTGELGYELSVRASRMGDLWQALVSAGKPLDVLPFGTEALAILRAEKGFILVGKDTDGETLPHDLGFAAPRLRKTAAFVGDRSLHTDTANDPARRNLVGLKVAQGSAPLPTGAHVIEKAIEGAPLRSIGIVTSSYVSPVLNRPIALAQIQRGAARMGEVVTLRHLGQDITAEICAPVFYDSEGSRLNA